MGKINGIVLWGRSRECMKILNIQKKGDKNDDWFEKEGII